VGSDCEWLGRHLVDALGLGLAKEAPWPPASALKGVRERHCDFGEGSRLVFDALLSQDVDG